MTITENKKLQHYAFLMVLLNAFATPMMLSAVNVALPHIADDLHMTAVQISWIPMAYLMASAMFILIFGRLADMLGRKKIFLIGTMSVIVTSILAAVATNDLFMFSARFLQGVSAAMLYATQIAIITSVFPKEKRGQMIGYTIAAIYLGLSIGPLIGGILIDQFGWRVSFIFHIPLAIIVLCIAIWRVPQEWSSDQSGSLDVAGSLIYAISICLLCVGVSLLPKTAGIILLALSLLGFVWFFRFENKTEHPIFNVSQFFVNRVFTFSCIASMIMYTATFANVVLISLYLQYLQGLSATTTGIIMMIQPLTMAVLSPISGRLSDKIEPRLIATAGILLTVIGLYLLGTMDTQTGLSLVIIALLITGAGFSLFSPPNVNAIMSSVEKRYLGVATASMATMRVVGQLSSMVLVTLFFNLLMGNAEISIETLDALAASIRTTFTAASILCVCGLYFSLARGRMHQAKAA